MSTTRRSARKRLAKDEIVELFTRLSELNPSPKTELEYATPFQLLVSVILSAQSTDAGVNKATRRLFPVAGTPEALVALGVEGLKPYIATIGLYNTQAANVVAMSRQLLDLHDGQVPRTREALEALPGVGRKTANVVLNTAFGAPTMAVDTHIFRVANRTGLAPGRTVRAVEDALLQVVPARFLHDAHHWLILHGRYTCKARRPNCPHCPIRDLCLFRDKTAPTLERPWSRRPSRLPEGSRHRDQGRSYGKPRSSTDLSRQRNIHALTCPPSLPAARARR